MADAQKKKKTTFTNKKNKKFSTQIIKKANLYTCYLPSQLCKGNR